MKHLFVLLIFSITVLSCKNENNTTATKQNSETERTIQKGKRIYSKFCSSCHLPNGEGVNKVFPPLANSDYLLNNRESSIRAIKYGLNGKLTVNGDDYNGVMAPLGLSDNEIADVMNYITNSWGNSNKSLITVEEVSKVQK